MKRPDVLRVVIDNFNEDILTICIFGDLAVDLYNMADRPQNFYMRGGMGLASSLGLGLALAVASKKVVVLDGDGSVLMNLGTFATIGNHAPANLIHIIFDNSSHQTAGGMATATAGKTDLAAIARGAGIQRSQTVLDIDAFRRIYTAALASPGPHLIVAKISRETAKGESPSRLVFVKERFMKAARQDNPNLSSL